MARARGGNTGFAVALVIFGCAFVIATLVAVIFYTKIETAKGGEQTALDERRKYVSDAETGPANDYATTNASVFSNMLAEIRQLKSDLETAQDSIATLTGEKEAMNAAFNEQVRQVDDLGAQIKVQSDQSEDILGERDNRIAALIAEKQELTDQIAALQAQVSGAIGDADAAAKTRIQELNGSIAALEADVFAAQQASAEWEDLYKKLLATQPKVVAQDATLPDGEIASIIDNSTDMFITLGRRDGLVMGMNFEVYDPDPVLKLSDSGEARGKATIEVYSLSDDRAICRVVRRSRGANLDPGDPIVNVGYDPNKDIKMVAYGYFDIERDGGTTDLARINTLILKSGAELLALDSDEQGMPVLTPDLDYIVLGEKPELPEPPSADDFDPEARERYRVLLAQNEAYFTVVEDAKRLQIPVMNLNRFLEYTGYYER